jgi:hypothetical protein
VESELSLPFAERMELMINRGSSLDPKKALEDTQVLVEALHSVESHDESSTWTWSEPHKDYYSVTYDRPRKLSPVFLYNN